MLSSISERNPLGYAKSRANSEENNEFRNDGNGVMKYGDVIRVKYMQFLTQKSRLNRKYDKVVFFF